MYNTTIYIRSNFYSLFKCYEMCRLKMNITNCHPKGGSSTYVQRGTENPFVLDWSISCHTKLLNCLAIFYNLLIIKAHSAVTRWWKWMILWGISCLANFKNWRMYIIVFNPTLKWQKVFLPELTILWYQRKGLSYKLLTQ